MPGGMRPGSKAFDAAAKTTRNPSNQPTNRQRFETKRPSGKSSRRNIGSPNAAGIKIQTPIQAAKGPPGSES